MCSASGRRSRDFTPAAGRRAFAPPGIFGYFAREHRKHPTPSERITDGVRILRLDADLVTRDLVAALSLVRDALRAT